MKIYSLLAEKKPDVLKKWFALILETYPKETSSFLKSQNSQTRNPVTQAIYEGIEGIFNGLVHEDDEDKLNIYLDNVIRVRAIQDFSPSEAVSFIFSLKEVIRKELDKEICDPKMFKELLGLETRIDSLANSAFEIYMKCREKIYEIKANEMRNWTYRALHKTGFYKEVRTEE
ncbi:MAG: RsbRD N-terminal domain-containing protein [Nitrospiraceae bacterium]|jgi:hypothetical protein|nr:MAG: RsbRD N-terminal domain-containing protein [Nitrospiraceae bacterium]